MKFKRTAVAVAGLGLAAGLVAGPAPTATAGTRAKPKPGPALKAGPKTTANTCSQYVGSITAAGMTGGAEVIATRPPTANAFTNPVKLFAAKTSDTWYYSAVTGQSWWYGSVISGTGLYNAEIRWDGVEPEPEVTTHRVGGGWDRFTQLQSSDYFGRPGQSHNARYGLRDDGLLFRWLQREGGTARTESYPGFAAVKAMTLISETATYDTLLATTRGGALYTIRIPVASPMKPVVKQVRKSTWQGFESLVAQGCGQQGILLTAIDHDTDSGYLYAVGHANGPSTVIQGLGKIPHAFGDPVHYSMTGELDNLFGE